MHVNKTKFDEQFSRVLSHNLYPISYFIIVIVPIHSLYQPLLYVGSTVKFRK